MKPKTISTLAIILGLLLGVMSVPLGLVALTFYKATRLTDYAYDAPDELIRRVEAYRHKNGLYPSAWELDKDGAARWRYGRGVTARYHKPGDEPLLWVPDTNPVWKRYDFHAGEWRQDRY